MRAVRAGGAQGAGAPVQYGPRVAAIIVYLYAGEFLSKDITSPGAGEDQHPSGRVAGEGGLTVLVRAAAMLYSHRGCGQLGRVESGWWTASMT